MPSLDRFTDPKKSLSVMASAGTGKTYLLIKRLMRILLREHQADTILALSFSNRAAGELHTRLHEETRAVNGMSDQALNTWLSDLGERPSAGLRASARALYHCVLDRPPVIISTFHGFCHDLVTRFALHNGRDSSFEVITNPKPWMLRARIELLAGHNHEYLAKAGLGQEQLRQFLDLMGSDYSLERALEEIQNQIENLHLYLNQRAHQNAEEALRAALGRIQAQSTNVPAIDTEEVWRTALNYCELLENHGSAQGARAAEKFRSLEKFTDLTHIYQGLRAAFVTQAGTWRKRLYPTRHKTKIEPTEWELAQAWRDSARYLMQEKAVALNGLWLSLGWCYLQTFQQVKQRHRLIDFDDMQMQAWQLLHRFEDHSAIQHKLSAQIRHILIDEFQDTSLLQWEIVRPFVNEIVCQKHEHDSSVFLIGDDKQMIYRFRGAETTMFETVCADLQQRYQVEILGINRSWRTCAAVLEWVNTLFAGPGFDRYSEHQSARQDLWGCVVCLPLVEEPPALANGARVQSKEGRGQDAEKESRVPESFADPFDPESMAGQSSGDPDEREAENLVAWLGELHRKKVLLDRKDGPPSPVQWRDVMLLSRRRKPFAAFERVFERHQIHLQVAEANARQAPYVWRTLLALLQTLLNPHDDLALLTVLCSPLFGLREEMLLRLVGEEETRSHSDSLWSRLRGALDRLARARGDSDDCVDLAAELRRAFEAVERYIALGNQIPTHDLVNIVYGELAVYERYCSGLSAYHANAMRNHLDNFLYSILDIQTGRYTSLYTIAEELEALVEMDGRIEKPLAASSENAARLMTVHQSKGLESPIVVLIDAHTSFRRRGDFTVLRSVDEQLNIEQLMLCKGALKEAPLYQELLRKDAQEEAIDNFNQFYVALTRASQMLVISAHGKKPKDELALAGQPNLSWYEQICLAHTINPDEACHYGRALRFADESPDAQSDEAAAVAEAETAEEARATGTAKTAGTTEMTEAGGTAAATGATTLTGTATRPGKDEKAKSMSAGRVRPTARTFRSMRGRGRAWESRYMGTLIHRVLALWAPQSQTPASDRLDGYDTVEQQIKRRIRLERYVSPDGVCPSEDELNRAIAYARQLLQQEDLAWMFRPELYRAAWNELAILHRDGGGSGQLFIDRLVDTGRCLWVIDYKSRIAPDGPGARKQMLAYHDQLGRYCRALTDLDQSLFAGSALVRAGFLSIRQRRIIPYAACARISAAVSAGGQASFAPRSSTPAAQ